ncbi:M67 family metallopeptidase [Sphingomonas morindae]|uniref:M67 family metallopeptidase n=1 Tax=Sphingomonas morindae TaxID=1541170 RepID=A0ABY4X877_9SPHN|nr:M67 family metallopeptidase [Sphingomonas morindae]USI73105.1 M67 family metallopeptidase [Sphingomonas morindae]
MDVHIARALYGRLIDAAAAAADREICGLLLGAAPDRIAAAMPAANVADPPDRQFELDPAALFAAMRAERAGGPRLLGHYHSHPFGPPTPSPRDAACANDAGKLWLIIGLGEARLWRAMAGGRMHGAFEPVRLIVDG